MFCREMPLFIHHQQSMNSGWVCFLQQLWITRHQPTLAWQRGSDRDSGFTQLPAQVLAVSLISCVTVFKTGLNILICILRLMTLRLTLLEIDALNACEVHGRKDLKGVSMVCTCGDVETPWPRAEQSNWAIRSLQVTQGLYSTLL